MLQCIWKLFTALHFFHILNNMCLIHMCLIPKLNKFFFFLKILHTTPHNDNMKKFFEMFANLLKIKKEITCTHVHKYSQPLLNTLLMHLWQQLQPQVFLNMMPQAWHTHLWAILPIPLCSTSQAQSGWMGSVSTQPFSDLSRDVQSDSRLWLGHLS